MGYQCRNGHDEDFGQPLYTPATNLLFWPPLMVHSAPIILHCIYSIIYPWAYGHLSQKDEAEGHLKRWSRRSPEKVKQKVTWKGEAKGHLKRWSKVVLHRGSRWDWEPHRSHRRMRSITGHCILWWSKVTHWSEAESPTRWSRWETYPQVIFVEMKHHGYFALQICMVTPLMLFNCLGDSLKHLNWMLSCLCLFVLQSVLHVPVLPKP